MLNACLTPRVLQRGGKKNQADWQYCEHFEESSWASMVAKALSFQRRERNNQGKARKRCPLTFFWLLPW
jgi:hypothetical protein